MIRFILLLTCIALTNTVNSQVNNPEFLFFLTLYKGKPPQPKKVVLSSENEMNGFIIYDNNKIESNFLIKKNTLFYNNDSIYLGDKKLSYLELLNPNSNTFKIERIN